MKKIAWILLLSSTTWILAACNTESSSDSNEKLDIYTTVYPLQDFAEKIGGEYVEVETIYPPGADEHTYEPSQQDMIKLAEGDLFFYIGLGLEGFVDSATDVLESQELVMVPTADYLSDEELEGSSGHDEEEHAHDEEEHAHDEEEHAHDEEEHAHDEEDHAHDEDEHTHDEEEHAHDEEDHAHEGHEGHDHGDVDPHVWLDPVLSKSLAESIKDSLVKAMPEQEAYFNENYEEIISQLDEIDHSFEELGEDAQLNQLFVSHAAYGHWETRYGFEQNAIAGISTSDEPSQRELTKIIELAKENNIQHILFEQNVSSNLTEVIQQEIGADALQLHNLSVLTEEDIDNDEDYFSLMEKNIETLRTALQAE
ncbi:metal ABC transporter solute-binding protein, Zn/Mn family [Jeotgalibacillus campisalis]|uniref:Adhesin n=1 Tax=Jeotgalibacillus campisalis TaxID=220754 RepID=A0A0C2VNI0_9BACL|nr:zinc ABC transporter substrate-binding protein [Jeotgalibacillus campisalis]KIL45548.1 adhesin [Jeotgalibacillus campisalis]